MVRKSEIDTIRDKIVPILREHKVIKAGIFGSFARGEQKKKSDVDILVEINDNNMGLLEFIKLKNLIEKALKKKIDLVEYEGIRKELKENILNDEIPIIR